jgi:uncharacterized membrane protein YtjA (UPF0391 family)
MVTQENIANKKLRKRDRVINAAKIVAKTTHKNFQKIKPLLKKAAPLINPYNGVLGFNVIAGNYAGIGRNRILFRAVVTVVVNVFFYPKLYLKYFGKYDYYQTFVSTHKDQIFLRPKNQFEAEVYMD